MGFLDRFKRKGRMYSGGSGSTQEDAVVISAANEMVGVAAEYAYISSQCGRIDVDWTMDLQLLLKGSEAGRRYDRIVIKLKNGQIREFWFDITQFIGRM